LLLFLNGINSLSMRSKLKQPFFDLKQGCVWLFEECGFKGRKVEICEANMHDFTLISFRNKVYSMKVGGFTRVNLWMDEDYNGYYLTVKNTEKEEKEIKCFPHEEDQDFAALSNSCASAKVARLNNPYIGCSWLFSHCNEKGNRLEVCGYNENFKLNNVFEDGTQSIVLGDNTRISLYEKPNYQGAEHSFFRHNQCLPFTQEYKGLNMKFQSAKVELIDEIPDDGCIWLYSECNYQGDRHEICQDTSYFDGFEKQASSLKVGRHTKVVLYPLPQYSGDGFSFDLNHPCFAKDLMFGVRAFDNQASSGKVNKIK